MRHFDHNPVEFAVFWISETLYHCCFHWIYQEELLTPRSYETHQWLNYTRLLNTKIISHINDKQLNTVKQFPEDFANFQQTSRISRSVRHLNLLTYLLTQQHATNATEHRCGKLTTESYNVSFCCRVRLPSTPCRPSERTLELWFMQNSSRVVARSTQR